MKLFYSPTSPYVRKVSVLAIETGLDARITRERIAVSPLKPDPALSLENPLVKIPTLVSDEGEALYDSAVICAYLDTLHAGAPLIPRSGPERWRVLRLQALADGLLDAAVLCKFEVSARPEEKRSAEWVAGQTAKAVQALDWAANEPALWYRPVNLGQIALACALGWLEFRQPIGEIRAGRADLFAWYDEFAKRPSMQATLPPA